MLLSDLHSKIVEDFRLGICVLDRDGRVLVWNNTAAHMTGYAHEEMIGRGFDAELRSIVGLEVSGDSSGETVFIRHKNKYRVELKISSAPLTVAGGQIGTTYIFEPVGESGAHAHDHVSSLAQIDRLTGLANQTRLQSIIAARVQQFRRSAAQSCMVMINLDDIAECNRKHGYETGNELLIAVAQALSGAVRDCDVIGRWSGKEFFAIFEIKNIEAVKTLGEKVRTTVQSAALAGISTVAHVTATVGATLILSEDSVDSIIHRTRALVQIGKQNGKNISVVG